MQRVTASLSLIIAALCVAIGVQERQKAQLRQSYVDEALAYRNSLAQQDTTRRLETPAVHAITGDSLAVYQHQAVQIRQQSDSLDRALQLERVARISAETRVADLERTTRSAAATREDSSSHVRLASFDVRQAPYTVHADVALPPPPDTGTVNLRVRLDSIRVVARLSCAAPGADGVRVASIEATTPAWASVRFTDVQQEPDLCNAKLLERPRSRIAWRPLVIGVGRSFSADRSEWSVFVGTGFSIGGE